MMPSAAHSGRYDTASGTAAQYAGLFPVYLVLAAALFNALIAIINARFKPLTGNTVIIAEIVIVIAAHLFILRHFQNRMVNWYFLIVAIGAFAILRIASTGNADAKYFRDIFLIITFILLGMTSNERRVIQLMAALQTFVIAGILLEAICLPCYNDLFAVKDFYINTRGLGEEEFTNLSSDLYVSATRPEARFLPFFDLHRMSSVFLEPVSLGNFMTVTVAFTAAFWKKLGGKLQAFFVASMILMLLACDGRLAAMASVAILAISAGHRAMPRHSAIMFLPFVVVLAVVVAALAGWQSGTDDLSGRIAFTVELIQDMTVADIFGISDRQLPQSVDAGVVYLIITQSIIGAALIWGFITLSANESTPEQKIYKNGVLMYLALTMMVSYSFLSIKTAAPIWFIFGALLSGGASEAVQVRSAPPNRHTARRPRR